MQTHAFYCFDCLAAVLDSSRHWPAWFVLASRTALSDVRRTRQRRQFKTRHTAMHSVSQAVHPCAVEGAVRQTEAARGAKEGHWSQLQTGCAALRARSLLMCRSRVHRVHRAKGEIAGEVLARVVSSAGSERCAVIHAIPNAPRALCVC